MEGASGWPQEGEIGLAKVHSRARGESRPPFFPGPMPSSEMGLEQ